MLGITGELADGWYPGSFFSARAFGEKARVVKDAASAAGRKPREIDLVANVPVVFGRDAKTMERLKKSFRRQLVINRYMLRLLGAEAAYEMVSKTLQYQLIAPTPAYAKILEKAFLSLPVTDETLERGIDEMMAVGTPSECTESVARFVRAGATHILVTNLLGGSDTLQSFARHVMPPLRG